MYESARTLLLRVLRVPPQPEAPAGSPDSVRVFHAGRNFYKWSVIRWVFLQIGAALSLTAGFAALSVMIRRAPPPVLMGWELLEGLGAGIFLLQLPLTFFQQRLGYEMRWYIVTDRSLRIRTGIWSVEELTMTFANIQQINVAQGPLQRVLGIADVEVTSAGGGGVRKSSHSRGRRPEHSGSFEGVDNADAIRDLVIERLRKYRDSGLGDPDDSHAHQAGAAEAAAEVLKEVQALRRVLT